MFLETATEFSRAYGYHNGALIDGYGLPDSIIERLKRHRANAHCAGCSQPIALTVPLAVRGSRMFHPSCARRHDAATSNAKNFSCLPTTIATLEGVALSFDRPGDRGGCGIAHPDGCVQHERFDPEAFDTSIARGGQTLCVNHSDIDVMRGRFLRLANDGGRLAFRFELYDGARERAVLSGIHGGRIRHCSIAFTPAPGGHRYDGSTIVYTRGALREISLCDGRRPAWHSTWVRAIV